MASVTRRSTTASRVSRRVQIRFAGSRLFCRRARNASVAVIAKAAMGTITPASARWK